jgi:hypothetical protein
MDTAVLDAAALGGRRRSGQKPTAGSCPGGAAERTQATAVLAIFSRSSGPEICLGGGGRSVGPIAG